jgi:hypothetical protein
MNLGQRTSHLGAQLDTIDGRKLAEQAYSRVDVTNERLAHGHSRGRHLCSRAARAMSEANPNQCCERD